MTTKHFLVIALTITSSAVLAARPHSNAPTVTRLVTGLEGGAGSTIGPDGALYVTEGAAGRISRVDPQTGDSHDVRQRSAARSDHRHRWGDGRRVHRQDRVRAGHPRRP